MDDNCIEALKRANDAYSMASVNAVKHESHEATCARRYQDWKDSTGNLNDAINRLDESVMRRIGGIYKILWTTSATAIVILLGAVGALAFFLLTAHK